MNEILIYAVFLGCEFVALVAMTSCGRGRIAPLRGIVAFALLAVSDIAAEIFWQSRQYAPDRCLAAQFMVCWVVFSVLIVWLSRDSFGRRIFLALVYGTYAIGYSSCFDVIVYRLAAEDFAAADAPSAGLLSVGLAAVAFLNFAFVRWILPRLPRDGSDCRWRDSCLVSGVMFVVMFASSHWPISVVSASLRDCVPFVLVSVAAWFVFPLVCGRMRDRARTADIAHNLELMMAEVKERRLAIDLARRLRHDQRHHRVQIAEYLLASQYDRVFDYLKALDEEAEEAPTDKLVWCENETVNAILSGASRQAAAKGVAFEVTAHVERTVGVADIDLVALLANLLENAIEAAARGVSVDAFVSNASGRGRPSTSDAIGTIASTSPKVSVALRQREHGLGITVTNPVPPSFALSADGLPCAEPGVGMESIRRVVGRYDGQWSYNLKDDCLKCQVILMFSNP